MKETANQGGLPPMEFVKRLRARQSPDIRQALDGIGVVFAVTLFFCLINAAYDGIVNRNPCIDQHRWWYPIYQQFYPAGEAKSVNC
jgi:hypothetical protein